ncbi:heme ABC exporter ATP-binding protein CcmA [Zavarzinia compransoris]|uniref:Heme ABC transporter ATP-binding protein CcmA n=1 Tax=Zavarzinia compransoris TaxID=1264899 RepID=A0A317E753_9PROT|nr:heme ABC exporter ATP-binding protein CcmA [Zavarzinia compransoris]PWR22066.1 heme ABC transporter ATP-binding protein CcmA [Zavarzinia compransoris]TDP47192.1 heme exporter protein A [Zavarzinia compransoris]
MLAASGLGIIRGERAVFAGLDLFVAPGEAVVLRGPNGAGKSTLLRLLAGLLAPTAGRVTWDGAAIDDDREGHGRRLRYAGHGDALKFALTVFDNLAFWARFERTPAAAVEAALDRLGLGALADLPAGVLSAGQKRRLGLARLALAPRALWLLDEPTVSLDAASVEKLSGLIWDHRAAGGMVVVATHDGLNLPAARTFTLEKAA